MKDLVDNKFFVIGVLLALLLISGFLPFYSIFEFDLETLERKGDAQVSNGWHTLFYLENLVYLLICLIFVVPKINWLVSRIVLIIMASFILFISFMQYLYSSSALGGSFGPTFKSGYYLMLLLDIALIIRFFADRNKAQTAEKE